MTTTHKDPLAVIEQLVTALESLRTNPNIGHLGWSVISAITAGREALEQTQVEAWRPTEAALTALRRFEETCADGEGYDIPKDTMQQLAMIGLVYRVSGSRYGITDFGNSVLATHPQASEPAPSTAGERTYWNDTAEAKAARELHGIDAQPAQGELATIAGLEASIGHLSSLVNQQLILLSDVNDTCGLDGHGGELEDGESEIIDRVRAHLAAMEPPARDTKAIVQQSAELAYDKVEREKKIIVMPVSASAGDLKVDIAELIQSHKYKGLRSVEVLGVFQFLGSEIISGSAS